jgi:thiol-disulfide isomerase/thioredoxin
MNFDNKKEFVMRFGTTPILFLLLFLNIVSPISSANSNTTFKELKNLQALAEKSKQLNLPIMLMFGAEWCEYCELLNEQVLTPIAISGLYEEKVVLMRHVGVDEAKPIADWYGKPLIKEKWAYELDADLTPTVVFFDGFAREVAPRIVGISEISLYASLIHQNLNIAYKNMGLTKQIPATPELLEQKSKIQTQKISE